jgi:hypothetical protein
MSAMIAPVWAPNALWNELTESKNMCTAATNGAGWPGGIPASPLSISHFTIADPTLSAIIVQCLLA